jgi:hypothetical protein
MDIMDTVGQLAAQVANPVTLTQSDGSLQTLGLHRNAEMMGSKAGHGTYYNSTARGNTIWACSPGTSQAGVVLKQPGQTSAAALTFYNPTGSGYMAEILRLRVTNPTTVLNVVAGIAWEGSSQQPSGVTLITPNTLPLGGNGGTVMQVYSACTITAMTFLGGAGINLAVTSSAPSRAEFAYDHFLVAPGYSINLVSTITQVGTPSKFNIYDLFWAEWLL